MTAPRPAGRRRLHPHVQRARKKFVDRSLSNEGGYPCLAWERYGDRCPTTPVHLVAHHQQAVLMRMLCRRHIVGACMLTVSLRTSFVARGQQHCSLAIKHCTVWRLTAPAPPGVGAVTHACSSFAIATRWTWRHLSARCLLGVSNGFDPSQALRWRRMVPRCHPAAGAAARRGAVTRRATDTACRGLPTRHGLSYQPTRHAHTYVGPAYVCGPSAEDRLACNLAWCSTASKDPIVYIGMPRGVGWSGVP